MGMHGTHPGPEIISSLDTVIVTPVYIVIIVLVLLCMLLYITCS